MRQRDSQGRFVKGVSDSSWGQQAAQNAVAPKAIRNTIRSLTPIEAWQLCSAVRSAVRARNEPFNQVVIRLFTKRGEEITGGDAFEYFQKPNTAQTGPSMLQALGYWTDLAGERMQYVRHLNGKMTGHVMNPMSAAVQLPVLPQFPEDIRQWRYTWDNGKIQAIDADDVPYDHDFNPSSLVRGNSPLLAVVNSITGFYMAQRYLRSFFGNNARPSNIVNIDTDNPDLVDPFKAEFLTQMQGENNAWQSFFTAGRKVTVTPLDAPMPDGPHNPIQTLITSIRDEVAALYMVPPLHGGMWDKTKFDSVEQQNDFFYESVWLPRLELLQRYMQKVADEYFYTTVHQRGRGRKMSRSFMNRLDKAVSEAGSGTVVVLDCDHIPAVAALKRKKVEYAQTLQETFHITPEVACEEVGLELDLGEASKLVWYPSNQKFIEGKPNQPAETMTALPMPQEVEDDEQDVTPEKTAKLREFFRAFRKLALERADQSQMWTLAQVDALAKSHEVASDALYVVTRRAFAELRPMQAKADKEGIKKVMNTLMCGKSLRLLAKAPAKREEDTSKKRNSAFLLALLAFFAWQATQLVGGGAATDETYNMKLRGVVHTHLLQESLASVRAAAPQSPEAVRLANDHVQQIANTIAPKLNATTQRQIDNGIARGLSRLDAIEAALKRAAESRAAAIQGDMTHVGGVIGRVSASQAQAKEMVWVTADDERVCATCGPLDGLVANAGQEFAPGIRWPVIDTHGNCRCVLKDVT